MHKTKRTTNKPKTMKKILFVIVAAFFLNAAHSQNVKADANGNFVQVKSVHSKEVAKSTGKMYINSKGETFPVYVSAKGKYFVLVTSKNGNEYKKYLKPE